jgi:hypothetical protein
MKTQLRDVDMVPSSDDRAKNTAGEQLEPDIQQLAAVLMQFLAEAEKSLLDIATVGSGSDPAQ